MVYLPLRLLKVRPPERPKAGGWFRPCYLNDNPYHQVDSCLVCDGRGEILKQDYTVTTPDPILVIRRVRGAKVQIVDLDGRVYSQPMSLDEAQAWLKELLS